jgi:hypothetical protein
MSKQENNVDDRVSKWAGPPAVTPSSGATFAPANERSVGAPT